MAQRRTRGAIKLGIRTIAPKSNIGAFPGLSNQFVVICSMSLNGPVIILEDDPDDEDLLISIFAELGIRNKVLWFTRAPEAFAYLQTTLDTPFIILSDINLPGMSGIEFKRAIDEDPKLRKKSIPFVFYSTSIEQGAVNEVYTKMTVQGFFQKPSTYAETKERISLIFAYWQKCRHPNSGG